MRGVLLLAVGRREGMDEFADLDGEFLASLAPLIAFPLVGAVWLSTQGQAQIGWLAFLARICGVLAQPVIIHLFARSFGAQGHWLRTATAMNWAFWLILPLLMVAGIVAQILNMIGIQDATALGISGLLLIAYVAWYQWGIIRTGLAIKAGQAVLVLLGIDAVSVFFSALPYLIDPASRATM